MFKKVSLFVLCGIILLFICGCGKTENNNSNNEKVPVGENQKEKNPTENENNDERDNSSNNTQNSNTTNNNNNNTTKKNNSSNNNTNNNSSDANNNVNNNSSTNNSSSNNINNAAENVEDKYNNDEQNNYSISSIDGIGKTFDRGDIQCTLNDLKVTKIVKENIHGTDYLYFYFDIIGTRFGDNVYQLCTIHLNFYNENNTKVGTRDISFGLNAQMNEKETMSKTATITLNGYNYKIIVE